MADLSSFADPPPGLRTGAPSRPSGRDNALIDLVELLFFAYRDFTADADAILAEFQFGRAHHRVLHFVENYPGLRVADLLEILKITKQSLARVLKQLVANGFIEQRLGEADRRERRLYTTAAGRQLARRLLGPQIERVQLALKSSRDQSEGDIVKAFLCAMIEPGERHRIAKLLPRSIAIPKTKPEAAR